VRHADYTTVELAVGSPARVVKALLRLDRVVEGSEKTLRIFSERLVESRSFSCDSNNATCYDVNLLTTRGNPNSKLGISVIEFDYVNPTVEYYRNDVARFSLQLSAELYAAVGYRYFLTNTHLCVSRDATAPLSDTAGALEATVVGGFVQTTAANLSLVSAVGGFAAQAANCSLGGGSAQAAPAPLAVFPYTASHESTYLALSDAKLYEVEPAAVSVRRRIVELGAACASTIEELTRGYSLYDIDCSNAYASCRALPSLPFRRVSTMDLRAHYVDGKAFFWFETDKTLQSLPGLSNTDAAVSIALVKLSLIILAAAVMWVRSDRVEAKSHWMYRHSVNLAAGATPQPAAGQVSQVKSDAALGLVAVGARFGVAIWRFHSLSSDDQRRVCLVELVAAVVSLSNWFVRYCVIHSDGSKNPLTLMGGSMAAVDASSAVLLAFAEPPLFLNNQRFDATARLLTGLLVSLVTLHRCLFSCTCCVVILEALREGGRLKSSAMYRSLLVAALVSWMYQGAALAVGLADLVVSPLAFALSRNIVGDSSIVGIALFLAFVTSGLPHLMATSVHLTCQVK
jgi:hypothetical protein